ncbi:AP-4-A phosphorylase [archaeon HR04]|mgnify:CR=1 FL=1|nr:AP-4-A phosphorylase [archaeon HR04]
MERLWAPWRIAYIERPSDEQCIFCTKPREGRDRKNLILMRGRHVFVILNAYPYANGHLMITPYRHVADPREVNDEEYAEIFSYLRLCISILKDALKADGFNIGMNIGKVAGAGIADHLHMHIVPRWNGDTNFMPVVGDTRIIPEYLERTYERLLLDLPEEEKARLVNQSL